MPIDFKRIEKDLYQTRTTPDNAYIKVLKKGR